MSHLWRPSMVAHAPTTAVASVVRRLALSLLAFTGITAVAAVLFFDGSAERGVAIVVAVAGSVVVVAATRRRRAAAGTAEDDQRLRTAVVNAPIGVAVLDSDGAVLQANPALCRLLERSEQELVTSPLRQLVHPDDVDVDTEEFAELVAGTISDYEVEQRLLRRDAAHVPCRKSVVRADSATRPYCIAYLVDVSDVRRIQTALARHERDVDEFLARQRDFVATASHELRTPLTTVIGYLELLDEEAHELADENRRFLTVARRSAGRLADLVDDLVVLDRAETRDLRPATQPASPAGMVAEAVAAFAPAVARRGVVLRTGPGLDRLPDVDVDPVLTSRALRDLLDNAVKFTPAGGCIDVRATHVGTHVRISVADTGPGIGQADVGRVFERFFRSQDTMRDAIGGTGLGLTIAKAIVERQGGRISVDSQPGHGSVFTVHLPVAAAIARSA
jgi:PAS domain S-box-containing protein